MPGRPPCCPSGPATWRSGMWPRPGASCDDLGVAEIIDEVTGAAAGGRGSVRGDVPGAGSAEPAGRAVLQGRRSRTGGRPPPRTGSPRSRAPALDHRRFWDAMHAVTLGQLEEIARRIAARIVEVIRRGPVLGGAGHDQLRHLHRHRQRQGTGRAAGQGQAETLRPAAGRPGPGRDPGRRDPADLARLPRQPARRHPVPRHDRPAAQPSTRRSARRPPSRMAPRT